MHDEHVSNDGYHTLEMENSDRDEPAVIKPTERVSIPRIFIITSFAGAYSMIVATIALLILPEETTRLFPEAHALVMGCLLAWTGLTQLCSPIVGYLSDRYRNPLGRRRPFLIFGGVNIILGLAGMFYARTYYHGWLYIIALGVATTGLNITYAGFVGLIPDIVPAEQMGTASGIMGVVQMASTLSGFAMFGFWLDAGWSYVVYASFAALSLSLTCIFASETPLLRAPSFRWSDLRRSFVIDRTTHHAFFWVFVVRTLYYMGVSIQAFILFYLRDIINVSDPQEYTSLVAMCGQAGALLVAYPAGKVSDRIGRKLPVVFACVIMGTVYILFTLFTDIHVILALSAVYGIGNGMFLAVDFVLGVETLPDTASSAKDMGVWGIAAFLGQTLGGFVNGTLLYIFGRGGGGVTQDSRYDYLGYAVIMSTGTFFLLLASLCLTKVQLPQKPAPSSSGSP